MAMVVIEGFRRSGRPDIAFKLAAAYNKKMAESSENTVEENYGEIVIRHDDGTVSITARPGQHAQHQHRPDFAGWGKGPPIYLGLVDVLGVNAGYDKTLSWNLRISMETGETMYVQNLWVNGGIIQTMAVTRLSETEYQFDVLSKTDFSFRLGSLIDGNGTLKADVQSQSAVLSVNKGPSRQTFKLKLSLPASLMKRSS